MARSHTTGDPLLDMAILGISAVVVLIAFVLVRWWQKVVYFFVPRVTEPVLIRSVHAETLMWNRHTGEEQEHFHSAVFERADGSWVKVYVTHHEYIMLREGERGLLTRKGRSFVSFEKQE